MLFSKDRLSVELSLIQRTGLIQDRTARFRAGSLQSLTSETFPDPSISLKYFPYSSITARLTVLIFGPFSL